MNVETTDLCRATNCRQSAPECTKSRIKFQKKIQGVTPLVGCVPQWLERRSLTGELSLVSARSIADV